MDDYSVQAQIGQNLTDRTAVPEVLSRSDYHRDSLRFEHRRTFLRLLWLGAVGTVIVTSLLPSSSPSMRALDKLHINDKIEHLGAYALLAFLPALHERWKVVLAIAVAMIMMGIGLEFGQLLLEAGRNFEVGDMVADACGVLIGMLIGWSIQHVIPHGSHRARPMLL